MKEKKTVKKKEKKVKKEIYLYAHNGAKYDIAILNEVLLKRNDFEISKKEFLFLNGGVINQVITNKNGVRFVFRDSCRIL